MQIIELTQGKVALVDDCDAEACSFHTWHAKRTKRGVYYAGTNIKAGKRYNWTSMHRFIMRPPDGLEVDHIDGDGLNNLRAVAYDDAASDAIMEE